MLRYPSVFLAAALSVTAVAAHRSTPRPMPDTSRPMRDRIVERGRLGERVQPNDNRVAAGTLRAGVLSLTLVARKAEWHPDGESAPGTPMLAFGEERGPARIPGPLVRAPAGTRADVAVRNDLPDSLRLYGLHDRTSTLPDTAPIVLAPGGSARVTMRLDIPGTYMYWGTTTRRALNFRTGIDAQLSGAIVIDPPGRRDPAERIFVLGMWSDTVHRAGIHRARVLGVVNGVSWPNGNHLEYTVGDSVHWRLINASADLHPMHLHGFFYRILSRGDGVGDTTYTGASVATRAPLAVTEPMLSGETMRILWIPERAGNWLFHCHIPEHFEPRGSLGTEPVATAMHDHMRGGMNGLVMGVVVQPRQGAAVVAASDTPALPIRPFRLLVRPNLATTAEVPRYTYAVHEGGAEPPPDSGETAPPVLDLVRGQPVRITVVNRLAEPTAVHWHGIELESYYDGVPGFSGNGPRVTPLIAPGDSFEVRFTPPRAGTFIYHTHANETVQQTAGLAGAIVVREPGTQRDPVTDIPLVVSSAIAPSDRLVAASINGRMTRAPLELVVGRTYRFRLIEMNVPRPVMTMLLFRDARSDSLAEWRVVGKDGAELPLEERTLRPARAFMGIGETTDVEFTPDTIGAMRLEVGFRLPPGAPLKIRTILATWPITVVRPSASRAPNER